MGEREIIRPTITRLGEGKHRIHCPSCHKSRKKHNQHMKEMSVEVDFKGAKYYCHHCGLSGFEGNNVNSQQSNKAVVAKKTISTKKVREVRREIEMENFEHNDKTINFLKERGISEKVIKKYSVGKLYNFREKKANAVGFPYHDKENKVTAVKWRSADKEKLFSQTGVCDEFFNINSIIEQQCLIISEGEIDTLTWLTV